MLKILLSFSVLVSFIFVILYFSTSNEVKSEPTMVVVAEPAPQYNVTEFIVEEGDVFASIAQKMGFSYGDAMNILDLTSSTYDFTSIRVGQPFRLYIAEEGKKVRLEYEKNKEEIVVIYFVDGACQADIVPINYVIESQIVSGVITSSLWMSGIEAGMPDDLIIKFANVFDWTIDFGMGVKNGDSFEVLYEKRFRDGKYVGTGKILAGKFINNGKEYSGYLFEDKDGNPAYYNEKGESMRKQFLRAPLEYRYISSGFSGSRADPISGVVGGHHAIDYAAALGTPVRAVGDGMVESVGWNKQGLGNLITIHHNGTYTTQYGHLSGFAKTTRTGAKVVQGQIIGFVGSTGHSTGPHLHYQIRKNGQLVNALTIDFPPGEAVQGDRREDFDRTRVEFDRSFKL